MINYLVATIQYVFVDVGIFFNPIANAGEAGF